MAALDYADLEAEVIALLQADPRVGDPVTVTNQAEPPAMDACPAVLVEVVGFTRIPRRIVANSAVGSPYDETVSIELQCWQFSAQSAADARTLRNQLMRSVELVLADNTTLGGRVVQADVLRGQFKSGQTSDTAFFAMGVLSLDAFQLV